MLYCDRIAPTNSWQQMFQESGEWRSSLVLRCVHELGPLCTWFRAEQFNPDPEYRYFSGNVWGALIAGQDDAIFSTGDRYIALLIVIDPHTTYPLHAHRIEELYYILSGKASWSHNGKEWDALSPGSLFHNRSYQPHTIRTLEHPLMTQLLISKSSIQISIDSK